MPECKPVAQPPPNVESAIPLDSVWDLAIVQAERLTASGSHEQSVEALVKTGTEGIDPHMCALNTARYYREISQLDKALESAEEAASLAPNNRDGWEMVLDLAEEIDDLPRAITASEALLRISPRHLRAHTTLNRVYMRLGDVQAALKISETLIQLEPDSALHHFNKALLCQHKSCIKPAVYEFIQTIRLDPEGPYSEHARTFLEDLDVFQINQIITLALDDMVFRTKLLRDSRTAVMDRGYTLSPMGEALLQEFCEEALPETVPPHRLMRYQ